MRKILISMMLAATTVAALPAQAAPVRHGQPAVQRQIQSDINQLDGRIDRALKNRTISQREALGVRKDARALQKLYRQYSRNGLDRREIAMLESRIGTLNQQLRMERRDRDGHRG